MNAGAAVSLSQAIQSLISQPRHLIVCDTCFLLDVVRLPWRSNTKAELNGALKSILKISTLIDDGKVSLVCPSPVEEEWKKNSPAVYDEGIRLGNCVERDASMLAMVSELIPNSFREIHLPYKEIMDFLLSTSRSFLDRAILLSLSQAVSDRSLSRVINYIPPSTKGAVKDCLVYEGMLEFFGSVPPTNSQKRIFATSNTNDFCDGGTLKSPLDVEVASLDVKFCSNWNWVYGELV